VGWGRVYADCLWGGGGLIQLVYGVGVGLLRLFVGDRINDEPAPTNLGFTIANSVFWGDWWGGGGFMQIVCR